MVRVRRAESAAADGLPCQQGLNVPADLDAGKVGCVHCETDAGREGGSVFMFGIPVLIAARKPSGIELGEIVRTSSAFACDDEDPPTVPIPFEMIMTLPYDVNADREAEIMGAWDEIEISIGEAEAGWERQRMDAWPPFASLCSGRTVL
jgi:hypothetical protein